MGAVAYVPGLSRNLRLILKTIEQLGKPLIYYKMEATLGFPGGESFVFNLCLRKGLFSAPGVIQISNQVVALGESIAGAGSTRTGRGSAGGDSESARHNGGTPHVCASERGHNAENGRGDENCDDRTSTTTRLWRNVSSQVRCTSCDNYVSTLTQTRWTLRISVMRGSCY